MATNKKPPKRHKSKLDRTDLPLSILNGIAPLGDGKILKMKLNNNNSILSLSQGKATRGNMQTLFMMLNFVKALQAAGFGLEHKEIATNGYILKENELSSIQTLMDLYDAQIELITIRDLNRAGVLIQEKVKSEEVTSIPLVDV
jgi:hypothetical protein